jgi:ribulose-5-phosphate 4-epimerase/fuculose-1-phosphate aldolase
MSEIKARDQIAKMAQSMFARGLTFGSSGNISLRLEDGWLMTPSGSSLGDLDPAAISKLDNEGVVDVRPRANQGSVFTPRNVRRKICQSSSGPLTFNAFCCG